MITDVVQVGTMCAQLGIVNASYNAPHHGAHFMYTKLTSLAGVNGPFIRHLAFTGVVARTQSDLCVQAKDIRQFAYGLEHANELLLGTYK